MNKKAVYFDIDNVLVDFPSVFDKLPPQTMLEYEGRLDEVSWNIFFDGFERVSFGDV